MKDLEKMLYQTDFSKNTDLKARLADKLFGTQSASSDKIVSFPFASLSADEAEMVSAARGLIDEDPNRKNFDK